jgi:mercuric reductase
MNTAEHFDLVILGSGSAAFAAAIKAAELGARVAMTENRQIGGTCVNRGCIPSKNLIRAAEIYHSGNHQPFSGLSLTQQGVNAEELIAQKDELVERLRHKKYIGIAEENERITVFSGQARFVAKDKIQVGNEILAAPKFLVATGARIRTEVGIEGLSQVDYLTSDLLTSGEPMELKTLPKSWVIIGGGFIACELGQMFRRLGAEVIMLERGSRLISGFDEEVSTSLRKILEEEGIQIIFNAQAVKVMKKNGQTVVTAKVEGRQEDFCGERLLLATGVVPNTEGLALEIPGVELNENGFIKVDDEMRTTAPRVWAAGDVTGPPLATPIGAREGVIAAENIMDECCHKKMDYWAIPRAIFTDPEVASVGLTIEQAKQQGYEVRANCLFLEHVPKAAAIRDTRGLVKMVIDAKTRRILGVHLIAHRGADVIHEAALAVRFKLTVQDIIDTIHVYPTMSEAIRMAAQTFTKDVSKLSCCAE